MSLYIFSLLTGYEFTGVDRAQGTRSGMLREHGLNPLHFFMTVPGLRELYQYQLNGIRTEEMAFAQQWFVEKRGLIFGIKLKDKAHELAKVLGCSEEVKDNGEIWLSDNGTYRAILRPSIQGGDSLAEVEYLRDGCRVIREFYTDYLLYREYISESSYGLKVFYDHEGRTVLRCWKKGGEEFYQLADGRTVTYADFCYEFFDKLGLNDRDTVIMDRCFLLDFIQPLFEYKNGARFVAVFRSDHYYYPHESVNCVGLAFEYFYWFRHSSLIDAIVVFTEEQKQFLTEKLEEYGWAVPDIYVIPSGGLLELKYPRNNRIPYSVLTVSRISKHKKVDMVVESVIKAHDSIPQLTLDVYGWGENHNVENLKRIIADNHAESYIKLKGFCDVDELYRNYEVYLSASASETMGLSVMEAIGSGNAIIGLDVRYGNRVFISNGQNGYLVPADIEHYQTTRQQMVDDLATALVAVFSNDSRLRDFHDFSYEKARNYLVDSIGDKWNQLLSEV